MEGEVGTPFGKAPGGFREANADDMGRQLVYAREEAATSVRVGTPLPLATCPGPPTGVERHQRLNLKIAGFLNSTERTVHAEFKYTIDSNR
jgi:hypothetical protein